MARLLDWVEALYPAFEAATSEEAVLSELVADSQTAQAFFWELATSPASSDHHRATLVTALHWDNSLYPMASEDRAQMMVHATAGIYDPQLFYDSWYLFNSDWFELGHRDSDPNVVIRVLQTWPARWTHRKIPWDTKSPMDEFLMFADTRTLLAALQMPWPSDFRRAIAKGMLKNAGYVHVFGIQQVMEHETDSRIRRWFEDYYTEAVTYDEAAEEENRVRREVVYDLSRLPEWKKMSPEQQEEAVRKDSRYQGWKLGRGLWTSIKRIMDPPIPRRPDEG